MDFSRIVALVGKPNVGKSRLFNRIAGKRLAIVHDEPGVTRDVNAVEIGDDFTLMDTGGIGLDAGKQAEDLNEAVEEQVFFAVEAAELILLVVDGADGCSSLDELILERLRRSGKEPLLVVNKIDEERHEERLCEFDLFGCEYSFPVSAEHGRGIAALREAIRLKLGAKELKLIKGETDRLKICFVGRPNVGKSSLCNRLLKSERLIVHEVGGTTRDSVELDLDYTTVKGEKWFFRLTDTAGFRRGGKVRSSVEYFSSVRSQHAIESADVVFLVLDARSGVTRQDKIVAGQAVEWGKALAVVVNKWDLALEWFMRNPPEAYADEAEFRRHFEAAVNKELFFMPGSPVLFVSALKSYGLEEILSSARRLDETQSRNLTTPRVNRLISRLVKKREPRLRKGKRLKVYYAVQTGNKPFRIRLFCNQATNLETPYQRYLEHGFTREFDLIGCPVRFDLVGKPSRKKEFFTPQKI